MSTSDDRQSVRKWGRLRSVADRTLLKHLGTLMSATVLSQLIAIGTQPVISRLYSDEQLGLFALWLTIPQTVALVAALRYDMAIVLPEEHREAHRMLRISLILILLSGSAVTVTCWVFADPLSRLMGNTALAPWLPWSGLAVVTLGTVKAMQYWFNRLTSYNVISGNRIQMSSTIALGKIAWGFFRSPNMFGLVGGHLLGQSIAALTLVIRSRDGVLRPSGASTSVKGLLHRYRKMPLLNAPNALIDGFRLNGITILVGAVYTTAGVGQFSQAWMLMQAPVTLITGAMSQVFYQRFATAKPGQMRVLVRNSIILSGAMAVIPFAVLLVITPWVFPWFLGSQWEQAGLIGQALVPWLFVNVASSPISTVFVVTNRQHLLLGFAFVYMAVPLSLLAILGPNLGLVSMMWVLSSAMAILLLAMITMTLCASTAFDRSHPEALE